MSKKLTTEEFIKRAKEVHGDKYDYSKVEYKGNHTKVCIICPEHGEFMQRASHHLNGVGCPKCVGKYKTTEEFIKRAKEVHGDKYDYSKTVYVDWDTPVTIICPEHGEFTQKVGNHLHGKGCKKCGIKKYSSKNLLSTEDFIKKARQIHGDKYDYSKVNYVNTKTPVCIICPEHGEFWQKPNKHLSAKQGCPKCAGRCETTEDFINKAKKIHGDRYDYSKVEYINNITPICIICPEHGEFWQTPGVHLLGCGCTKCVRNVYDNESFIEACKKVHDNKYDYSKVKYTQILDKICIICPEHGEFWQRANHHLRGIGCPKCSDSKLEKKMREYLTENDINFVEQKMFDWLKYKGKLRLDFFLPDYNIAIECQGGQHFVPVDFSGKGKEDAQKQFKLLQKRDKLKKKLCEEHNIKMVYVTIDDINDFDIRRYLVDFDLVEGTRI